MNFKPKHNHVVIKLKEEVEQKFGNIVISTMGNERPLIGTVVAVGIGTFTMNGTAIPIQVSIGETVFIPAFGGQKITTPEGEEFVVLKDQDILTAVED
ncbi:MAG: co-chaperone GroES family protein [Nanoarchaeota archaeon]